MTALDDLIKLLSRLPGIGKKSATRIAFSFLKSSDQYNNDLGALISSLKEKVKKCADCGNYTADIRCPICEAEDRNSKILCVVEEPKDIMMIESTGDFSGLYHVLHGVLAPLDGVGPEELGLPKLVDRIKTLGVEELILATNPTLEGDSTALYIRHLIDDDKVKVSRIASGLPVGGDMEYADTLSISRAFKGRLPFSK